MRHYPNPENMDHEDKSKKAIIFDEEIALENFMTNFVKESSINYANSYINSSAKSDKTQEFTEILNREFNKLPKGKIYIEPFRKQIEENMGEYIKEMEKNLIPKINQTAKQVKKRSQSQNSQKEVLSTISNKIRNDNKVYKSKSASFYKKLSQLCTKFGLSISAEFYMNKSQEIKLEVMRTKLSLNKACALGPATHSSGRTKQNEVRQR